MPNFNANLSMMFNEVGFLERFGAAAKAGGHVSRITSAYNWRQVRRTRFKRCWCAHPRARPDRRS
jgi:hydroxypyruvate isomerase